MKLKKPRSLLSQYRISDGKKAKENSDGRMFVRKFLMPALGLSASARAEEIAEKKGVARSKLFLDVARFLVLNKDGAFRIEYKEWDGSISWRAVATLRCEGQMSDMEIFDLYGLIVGMMRCEEKFAQGLLLYGPRAGRNWYRQFENHPSIVKARKIYERISAEETTSLNAVHFAELEAN